MEQAANLEENTQPNQQSLDSTAAAAAQVQGTVEKAFTSMGEAMLQMAQQQNEMAQTVNQVIADRNQQLELVGTLLRQNEALAERVLTLTKLVDSDHAVIEVLAGMKGGKNDVN